MSGSAYRLGLLLTCLVAASTQAADRPGVPEPCREIDLDAGAQGTLIELHDRHPTAMSGPGLPGEVSFTGDFVFGLLDPCQVTDIRRRHPDAFGLSEDKACAKRLVVVLDPGHGGKQTGAIGVRGLVEKDLALDVARLARETLLRVPGIDVVMTRLDDEDIPLWDRVDMANEIGANVFISVHANAFPKASLGGVETFFHSIEASGEEAKRVADYENDPVAGQAGGARDTLDFILQDIQSAERLRDSSRLAYLVQAELARTLPFENRGVMQADFVVLRGTRMASVLVELGFLTHPGDEKVLKTAAARKDAAEAIKRGVVAYRELLMRKLDSNPREVDAR